jgi:hypothetical protein
VSEWITIAPIFYYLDRERKNFSFELGQEVCFSSVPNWLREEKMLEELSPYNKRRVLSETKFALFVKYQASTDGEPVLGRNGKRTKGKQENAFELLRLANLALWLAQPTQIGFEVVIDACFDNGRWFKKNTYDCSRLVAHKNDLSSKLNDENFELAREIFRELNYIPRDSALWMAIRTLWMALTDDWWESRYLLLWVVLEALFGPEDAKETTYRLSQRIALFISDDRLQAKDLFSKLTKYYSWRSKVVHGMRLKKNLSEDSGDILFEVESFARNSIRKILANQKLKEIFVSKSREKFLNELVFTA